MQNYDFDLCKPEQMEFVQDLLAQAERNPISEEVNNYMHTHDRVWFNEKEKTLTFEEVCVNEYGSSYEIGIGGVIHLTDEQVKQLPGCLTGVFEYDRWWDFPAI